MKILLVGEFSRLHNSLKEGLVYLGHEVTLIGDGDHFKNYPVDISLQPKCVNSNWLFRKIKVAIFKLTTIDLGRVEAYLRFLKNRKKLKDYDVVQFIHSDALKLPFSLQLKQVQFLKKHNKKLFLLTCGNDFRVVSYNLSDEPKYSPLTPYLTNNTLNKEKLHVFIYASKKYEKYYWSFEKLIEKIIPVDIDYVLPLRGVKKGTNLIPTPINLNKLNFIPFQQKKKVHIFMGVNEATKIRKGVPFFEEALNIIEQKYADNIKVTIVKNLPYQEYIKIYTNADIMLDVVYGYDQGYNALEAMAQGKVVFTGAEAEFLAHYGLQENEVCINALPDVTDLVNKLSWLIENPQKIKEIGENARKFVEKEHDYIKITSKYLTEWNS